MTILVISPPSSFLTLADAKAQLNVTWTSQDSYIQTLVDAACSHIDGASGQFGRSFNSQTLELRTDTFCDPIRLFYGPVQSITSVKYLDSSGTEQTISSANYVCEGDVLSLVSGATWPTPVTQAGAVRVRYVAGDGVIPAAVMAAAKIMVTDLFEMRASMVGGTKTKVDTSATFDRLMSPFKAMHV